MISKSGRSTLQAFEQAPERGHSRDDAREIHPVQPHPRLSNSGPSGSDAPVFHPSQIVDAFARSSPVQSELGIQPFRRVPHRVPTQLDAQPTAQQSAAAPAPPHLHLPYPAKQAGPASSCQHQEALQSRDWRSASGYRECPAESRPPAEEICFSRNFIETRVSNHVNGSLRARLSQPTLPASTRPNRAPLKDSSVPTGCHVRLGHFRLIEIAEALRMAVL